MSIDQLLTSLAQARKDHTDAEAELRKLMTALEGQFKNSQISGQQLTASRRTGKGETKLSWSFGEGFTFFEPTRAQFTKLVNLDAEAVCQAMELLPSLIAQMVISERVVANNVREALSLSQALLRYAGTATKTEVKDPEGKKGDRFDMIG